MAFLQFLQSVMTASSKSSLPACPVFKRQSASMSSSIARFSTGSWKPAAARPSFSAMNGLSSSGLASARPRTPFAMSTLACQS